MPTSSFFVYAPAVGTPRRSGHAGADKVPISTAYCEKMKMGVVKLLRRVGMPLADLGIDYGVLEIRDMKHGDSSLESHD
jgi:hypothetical protein